MDKYFLSCLDMTFEMFIHGMSVYHACMAVAHRYDMSPGTGHCTPEFKS